MLKTLHVKNLGIIEDVEIELSSGLICFTGETGAGKSLIIDAIGLLLGARAEQGVVRSGEREALVEAIFWTKDLVADDNELFLRRTINADGRSKAYIQGRLSSVRELRELSKNLVSVAGQHAFIELSMEGERLKMLDAYLGLLDETEKMRSIYHSYVNVSNAMRNLEKKEAERERRLDYLRYVISQIEQVSPKRGEYEDIKIRVQILRSVERLKVLIQEACQDLYDAERSAFDLIAKSITKVKEAVRIDPKLQGILERLDGLGIEIKDLARELYGYISKIEDDPQTLVMLEERLNLLEGLSRRFGGSIEGVFETLADAKREMKEISSFDEELQRLKGERQKLEEKANTFASSLSLKRRDGAKEMAEKVKSVINSLAMEGANFCVEVSKKELSETGIDKVDFLIETNPGEGLKPLDMVSSGGELSRITLALYSILSSKVGTPVMVYDEIDTGVSGAVAEKMAQLLRKGSEDRQILVVTHHGQLAAMADKHFVVEKKSKGGRSVTEVREIEGEERLYEIARLLGGSSLTDTVLAYAKEILGNKIINPKESI